MGEFRVRRATRRDIDALVSQRHRMFEDIRHRTEREHRIGDDAYRAWALKKMKEGELNCYLATDRSGRVVGGGCVWLREEQPGPGYAGGVIPYVLSMYTDPEFRRRGIAKLIMKEMVRRARRDGYGWMTLHASRHGRKVYPGLGWKRDWEMYLKFD
jgi:GNAT superfamily N-acetyltransferase